MKEDPPELWLEPRVEDGFQERTWCRDDVWSTDLDLKEYGPPTRYVREDIHQDALDKIDALESELREAVFVAWSRGATEWAERNYSAMVAGGTQKGHLGTS